jgi:STAS-like domain of unknown function (DUF4325)
MVIRALDHVRHCNTAAEGIVINKVLRRELARSELVELSFDGVFDVPSSFVNTAIVSLLEDHDEEYIKRHLKVSSATRQIADMVRRCLANGIRRRTSKIN